MQYLLVFIEGLLSFFSPCILPMLPIYMGYLGNRAIEKDKLKIFINTLFFVLGIATSILLLGGIFTALGSFLAKYKEIFNLVAGILIALFALFAMGKIKFNALEKEYRFKINTMKRYNEYQFKYTLRTVIFAYLLGFTFSFAWTPCIGPMLSSVMLMTAAAETKTMGILLTIIYIVGLTVPFLFMGVFSDYLMKVVNKNNRFMNFIMNAVNITLIIAASFLIFNGYYQMNKKALEIKSENKVEFADNIFDFVLEDTNGDIYRLSDYKGKTIFINFFTTWCPPCQKEMPYINDIYKETGKNKGDVIILTVCNPSLGNNSKAYDISKNEIKAFINKNKYTFPVLYDITGNVFDKFEVTSFPTTVVIGKDGNIKSRVYGMMYKDKMEELIK